MSNSKQAILSNLPAVDQVLARLKERSINPSPPLTRLIRHRLAKWRHRLVEQPQKEEFTQEFLLNAVTEEVFHMLEPAIRRAINATGIILHTNLGRAPLSEKAAKALLEVGSRYCNLELDLDSGMRDSRHLRVEEILSTLAGSEGALVVNNNAAAVLLVLDTLAAGSEVLVSRGELVEIGGSFRIPDIMKRGGAILKEVGTTNRTRIADYKEAIGERTRMVMKVHTSNYRIVGFTETPALEDLTRLAITNNLISYYDLGSAAFWPVPGEPPLDSLLAQGFDLVSFSGDKLLGGPQAGIIVGRKELIAKMAKNNLHRALRVDKLSLCALDVTLRSYMAGKYSDIPVFNMFGAGSDEMYKRTADMVALLQELPPGLKVATGEGDAFSGGGTLPEEAIPGPVLRIKGDTEQLVIIHKELRQGDPAVIVGLRQGVLELNLRTVSPREDTMLVDRLIKAANRTVAKVKRGG